MWIVSSYKRNVKGIGCITVASLYKCKVMSKDFLLSEEHKYTSFYHKYCMMKCCLSLQDFTFGLFQFSFFNSVEITCMHAVHINPEYRTVCPLVGNGIPPPLLHLVNVYPSPLNLRKGEHTRLRLRGRGTQLGRLRKSLALCLLCACRSTCKLKIWYGTGLCLKFIKFKIYLVDFLGILQGLHFTYSTYTVFLLVRGN